jgi:integrase
LRAGRWLAGQHPALTSPEQWTYDVAIEYVGVVDRLHVGDYTMGLRDGPEGAVARRGQPLLPRAKAALLGAVRAFFRDCQEWTWLPVRFNPQRALRTPRSLRQLIGPDPRVIDSAWWAKLLWAALNLTGEDLPQRRVGVPWYPLELVRALAAIWCFAGLRSNEIVRLRLGCIRWQHEAVTVPETGAMLPQNAVCFLDVPVNKTMTAFAKPVHPLVGERIDAWERVRAAGQRPTVDRKTGAVVQFLLSHRGKRLGSNYLNHSLIPALCRKAGIPEHDARGHITSHRARATIASMLYNAVIPMSLVQLQEWLGHRDPGSTQHYAKVSPTKLAKAYADTAYLQQNARLVEVLLDVDSLTRGEEGLFYDLGHGLCANPYWWQCPHRMACVRCSFYRPTDDAHLIRTRAHLRRLREEVPLTEDEVQAADGDATALEQLIARNAGIPPPTAASKRHQLPVIPLRAARTSRTDGAARSADLDPQLSASSAFMPLTSDST